MLADIAYKTGGDLSDYEKERCKLDLYLPAGSWRDLKRGQTLEGGRRIKAHPAPLDVLPVFVRVGSTAERVTVAKP